MRVIFTKKLQPAEISRFLHPDIQAEQLPAIRTVKEDVIPSDLAGKSLIFTSVAGVDSFFANGFQAEQNFTKLGYNKIYAVGVKTKRELRRHGFETYKTEKCAADLAAYLRKNAYREEFLHFCGNLALSIFGGEADGRLIRYRQIPIYKTELLYPEISFTYDGIAFFSPSGARSICTQNQIPASAKVFSIGKTTTTELLKYLPKEQIITSTLSNLSDLIKQINYHYAKTYASHKK